MKQVFASIFNLSIVSIFAVLLSLPGNAWAQDLTINNDTTIANTDPPEEVDNVIFNNASKLTITGTLIVNGSFNMVSNNASLELGQNARLIIYGDFTAGNKVTITLKGDSYLFVYGDFSKGGSDGQDVVIIDNAKIYILGNDDNWGDNLTDCDGGYDGNTDSIGDSCDFGNEDDYENNQETFPEDLVEQLNCYDLSGISNQTTCLGGPVTFSVADSLNVDESEVSFRWQEKVTESANWNNISGETKIEYTINRVTEEMADNRYRVIVKPKEPSNSNCKISISTSVNFSITNTNSWTGATDTNWNNTSNWTCGSLPSFDTNVIIPEGLPSGNYPEISSGANAFVKDLNIENNAWISVENNWLRIAGKLTSSGILKANTGSISFEGTSGQIIPGSSFENNRIENLRIDNASGVVSESILEITGILNMENGNLDTGDKLTLISDEIQTALIDGSGNGEVSGLVSMQRYLDKAYGYKYFSTPFQNSEVGDFDPYIDLQNPVSDFPNFYRYDENRRIDSLDLDATGWSPYLNTANSLNISEGYAINFGASSTPLTIELSGEVNNGSIPAKELLNHHRSYTRGFHLVGNPYPSPIDWNSDQGWTRNNIDNGIYFFTASSTNQYTGTYTSYVNDISTAEPTVDGRSSSIIPSMQGFFIKVSDSDTEDIVTGDFGMDNRVRVTNFDQQFLRTQISAQKPIIRLEAGFNGAAKKDPLVIYFSPFSTPEFEKDLDAYKLMNTDPAVPSFYNLVKDGKELSINAIPFPEAGSNKKIALGIKADLNGEMKISLNSIENLNLNFKIYLIDHAKGIGQNLSQDPEYRFNIKEGIHNSRFELLFSEEKLANPAIAFDDPFIVETRNGEVIVKLNLEVNQKGILRASNMSGQILQVKKASGKEEVFLNGITSDGVYIINLQLGKNHFSKKVIIKK